MNLIGSTHNSSKTISSLPNISDTISTTMHLVNQVELMEYWPGLSE
jgi:hypothetical protein